MGHTARNLAPLHRDLLRHPGGPGRRGRVAPGARDPGDDGPGGDRCIPEGSPVRRDDRRLLHVSVDRTHRTRTGRGCSYVRSHPLRRGTPHDGDRQARRQDLALRARARRDPRAGSKAALYDRNTTPLHRRREDEGGEPQRRGLLHGRHGDVRSRVPPASILPGRRGGPPLRLQGRGACHVREPRGWGLAAAPRGGRERDQPHGRREDHWLLAGPPEPGGCCAGERTREAAQPSDCVHEHDSELAASGYPLGQHRRSSSRAAP